jgi:Raf kinase inhibitor-like YbhB/YbcL family protein
LLVLSPAFTEGGRIPVRFANVGIAGGMNVSVPLRWEGEPASTRSFVVAIIDRHPVARGWVHWLVTDVPARAHSLDEGSSGTAMPAGAAEMPNSWKRVGYGGPQPPAGTGTHDYRITVFAMDVEHLGVAAVADWPAVQTGMRGHVLAEGELTGRVGP